MQFDTSVDGSAGIAVHRICFLIQCLNLLASALLKLRVEYTSVVTLLQRASSFALAVGVQWLCRPASSAESKCLVKSFAYFNLNFASIFLATSNISAGNQTVLLLAVVLLLWQVQYQDAPKNAEVRNSSRVALVPASRIPTLKTHRKFRDVQPSRQALKSDKLRSRPVSELQRSSQGNLSRRASATREWLDEEARQGLLNLSHWYSNSGTSPRGSALDSATRIWSSQLEDIEILCVDDNAVDRAILKKLLKKHGLLLTCEASGESALQRLSARRQDGVNFPSLVIMDLFMSGMSGIETAREIRELYPLSALPIIFLSGEEDPTVIGQALDAGGNDYIAKPFTEEELLARIRVQLHMLEFWQAKVRLARDSKLLKEILPSTVIDRLHGGERRIADSLDDVTVLFSDIVGFTDLAGSVPTTAVVEMLDKLFRKFDELTEAHCVYKVETIGDAYMVVAGLDAGSRVNHAERALNMARDMIAAAGKVTRPDGSALQIRIGLHSGPAYAGVVGTKRPRFCLFGDTVNVASRMESTSFPQCIHVSSAARDRYFSQASGGSSAVGFVDLGLQEIKGKGLMRTWVAKEGGWKKVCMPVSSLMRGQIAPPHALRDDSCDGLRCDAVARQEAVQS
uniref:Guanylate cyclase soluble subunit beta n=1 Tax=Tetraselmis sp. GSL018 TaxID=582737 RepID=A0A061R1S9_9CHLO|eukprot:CAMPEP_0177607416 /NCGR_PEP_ID=MMETSP0419_2-20121207/17906_1 /TAXON_ID=582737 /ORGANISM="Tetraselmis sp., Strain GSL018" /LENGTH=624 /DNA_ID=CAMNT_0019101997 /DNA_START=390 /DNA_END=2264 /DNA_ORIENTATION=+